jgi:hypothetical protein
VNDATGARYVVRLGGQLDPSWSEWLGGMEIVWDVHGNTLLLGRLADQAALHGLLTRIRDLGVPLLSVQRVN